MPKPKRARCLEADCGKKGVGEWKVSAFGLSRSCQFCGMAWGEAGWALATKIAKEKS
ncbi:hypothetical protein J2X90_000742 [Variovorax paradoxus]|uniref:hypothetical protein n=1 Tax=Variovorax paradoxus TaxID=34073 RepID=UPI00278A20BF|nr:hypothetical protein [Variovorax paradoxus]MDQ0022956.1 hypothetical protein [Variovorax paradoxus]